MVSTCYTSNRTCKHHHAGHSTRREETRQTKEMLARQHQGMDGAASRQDHETSRRQRRLDEDHQNICGAPTSHTSDLKIGTPVPTRPGAWRYRVSAGTGWPGVSIL